MFLFLRHAASQPARGGVASASISNLSSRSSCTAGARPGSFRFAHVHVCLLRGGEEKASASASPVVVGDSRAYLLPTTAGGARVGGGSFQLSYSNLSFPLFFLGTVVRVCVSPDACRLPVPLSVCCEPAASHASHPAAFDPDTCQSLSFFRPLHPPVRSFILYRGACTNSAAVSDTTAHIRVHARVRIAVMHSDKKGPR